MFATTKGIRVSVKTDYEGRYLSKQGPLFVFKYEISIENFSPETVQLLNRHWFIFDSAEGYSELEGAGVIGKQPVLAPREKHRYQSGCHLRSSMGMMRGYYEMLSIDTGKLFKVKVPPMQFFAPMRLN